MNYLELKRFYKKLIKNLENTKDYHTIDITGIKYKMDVDLL